MNDSTNTPHERERATLVRLERFARLTDSRFRIPWTRIRFGIGPLIGLVPVAGDFAGLLMSLYLIQQARRVGAPGSMQLRMLGNGILDAVGGMLPFAGDVFDVFFRANNRNVALLREHLEARLAPPASRSWPRSAWLAASAVALLVLLWLILM